MRDPVRGDNQNSRSLKSKIWSGTKKVAAIVGQSVLEAILNGIEDETGIPLATFAEGFKS